MAKNLDNDVTTPYIIVGTRIASYTARSYFPLFVCVCVCANRRWNLKTAKLTSFGLGVLYIRRTTQYTYVERIMP